MASGSIGGSERGWEAVIRGYGVAKRTEVSRVGDNGVQRQEARGAARVRFLVEVKEGREGLVACKLQQHPLEAEDAPAIHGQCSLWRASSCSFISLLPLTHTNSLFVHVHVCVCAWGYTVAFETRAGAYMYESGVEP